VFEWNSQAFLCLIFISSQRSTLPRVIPPTTVLDRFLEYVVYLPYPLDNFWTILSFCSPWHKAASDNSWLRSATASKSALAT
jgi:hypothetical protein